VNTDSAAGVNGGRRPNLARGGAASGIGWTPGAVYEVGLNEGAGPNVAPSQALALNNLRPLVTIANPIAIQAFLLSNEEGRIATVADPAPSVAAVPRVYNSIGPFVSDNGSVLGSSVKSRVATSAVLATGNQQNFDPDREAAEYNQALANGNRVTRVDLYPFGATPGTTRNVNYGKPLISTATGSGIEATYEPTFYLPVAASAGMINHGKPGSTDVSNNRKTLRIVNRSLQGALGKVRVELRSDALFQSWPGVRPNVRPIDGLVSNVPAVGTGNPRFTPTFANGQYRMRPDGIINYLPWEQPMTSSLPWERDSSATTLGVANTSRDYPDIAAKSDAASNQKVVRVVNESGDLTQSNGTLKASIGPASNLTVLDTSIRNPFATGGGNFQAAATSVNITVPLYQPANLVAMHSLTSMFVKPSADEAPGDGILDGEIQLPRTTATGSGLDRAFNDRGLRLTAPNSALATGNDPHTVTPMGYTLQMRAYIDVNGDGNYDPTEPYRDFETWFGVPVDVTLKQNGAIAELPGANGPAFAHGTGHQNGYLGYGSASIAGGNSVGFLPPFLQDSNIANLGDPYNKFFKPFNVKSESNINLWNVRASQKIEQFNRRPTTANPAGDGDFYQYFAMQSTGIEPRFGILAVGADPTRPGYNPTGIMPNVVTSLDRRFDAAWDAQFNNPATSLFDDDGNPANNYNPLRIPVPTPNGIFTRYQLYYRDFGGRHTLHKPTPGAPVGSGTLLSVPDVPAGSLPTTLSPGPTGTDPNFPAAGVFLPPVQAQSPALGVAVPLGTPSGRYSNNVSGTPLAFFEDHDTTELAIPVNQLNEGYRSITTPDLDGTGANTLRLQPAGPLYGNQNLFHPGVLQRNGLRPIVPATAEGILRPRRIVGIDDNNTPGDGTDDVPIYEYLPSTTVTTSTGRSAFEIAVNVKESPLTGQIADQALSTANFAASIVNGVLPGIDNAPLFDFTNIGAGNTARPVSSLAPAAYRTAEGNLILFHNSNATVVNGVRTGDARPGAPFNLFRSVLSWDRALGTWVAANRGTPITGDALFNPTVNVGGWFDDPTLLSVGNATNESNLSPFVLHDPVVTDDSTVPRNLTTAEATLFVMNVIPTTGSDSQYSPYFAPLGSTGVQGAFTSLLPRTGDNRLDPSVRRFSPRAVYVPTANAAFVMYYGGTAGKNNILYVAAPANQNGGVTGPGTQEIGLRLPTSVTSASDPMPIVRQVRIRQIDGVWRYDPTADPQYVVDVHYTAVLRTGGSADICVSRFRFAGTGAGARLQPIDMPSQTREALVATSRAPVYRSKHFGWYNRLDGTDNVPLIEVTDKNGVIQYQARRADWQLDNATRLLFQQLKNAAGAAVPNLLVYVDTSAGVVTFRGASAPSPANANLVVRATYLPLAYRVAATDAVESSTFGFMDRRPVDTTVALPEFGGVSNDNGNVLGWYSYGVRTRYNGWTRDGGAGIDRQWLYWQRSATAAEPASLFHTTRRVGIDLKALGVLTAEQSLKLSIPPAGGSVYPLQIVVGPDDDLSPLIVQVAGTDIPFEVDYKKGRIYTQASLEGLTVIVRGKRGTFTGGDTGAPFTAEATLIPIDEITGGSEGVGRGVPSNRRVNENQPYAFLDLFDGRAVNRTSPTGAIDLYPDPISDPALQPGRVWMFWSSSQGRSGLARVPDTTFQGYFNVPVGEAITTSGYDLFWQTLAPNFNYPSFSGFP
jgi:hypothetical protein